MQNKPVRKNSFSKPKVDKTDPARFRRTTRLTWHLMEASRKLGRGPPNVKAKKVAELVLEKIPTDLNIIHSEKNRLFRRSAHNALLYKKPIGPMQCAERCNLAIALLNASGVKSWLARVIYLERKTKTWHFHDYAEFVSGERVYTLVFGTKPDGRGDYTIIPDAVEQVFKGSNPVVFRATDSKQIGGVDSWATYKAYSRKLNQSFTKEMVKNRRRLDLLIREGIIPQEALWHI